MEWTNGQRRRFATTSRPDQYIAVLWQRTAKVRARSNVRNATGVSSRIPLDWMPKNARERGLTTTLARTVGWPRCSPQFRASDETTAIFMSDLCRNSKDAGNESTVNVNVNLPASCAQITEDNLTKANMQQNSDMKNGDKSAGTYLSEPNVRCHYLVLFVLQHRQT